MTDETLDKPEDTQQPQSDPETATEEAPEETPEASTEEATEESAEKLPENIVEVEDAGTLRKKVVVTVPRERIDAKLNEMFGELNNTAQVPGFRIGHAPRRLIEKRFGSEVSQDVRNAILGESLGDAIEKAELKTLGEPDLDLDEIELPDSGDMEFSFEVEIAPEFDLPETKGIKVEKPAVEVDDARVDAMLEQWRQGRASYEDTDTAAKDGDTVIAGAKITGEGIDEVDCPGLNLRVAPGQIEGLPLVDLGKKLAGKKAGKVATITVNVPEAHPKEEWRGKELKVEITVSQVRRRVLPEINDEFAGEYGMDSLDELREQLRLNLQDRVATETRRSMRAQVGQYLLDNTDFDLPEGVIERHAAGVLRRRAVDLLMQGVPREKIDENLTQLQAAASEEAKRELKLSFILAKVAEREEIEIDDEAINARVAQMATEYNRRPERLRQELARDGKIGEVGVALAEEAALNRLLEQAEVTETDNKNAEKEAETADEDEDA